MTNPKQSKPFLHIISSNSTKPSKCGGKTCRTHCTFYNDELSTCLIYRGLDYDDPNIARRCLDFSDFHELEQLYKQEEQMSEEEQLRTFESELMDLLIEEHEIADYPYQPEHHFPSIPNLEWYVAPDESFGCWLLNKSQRPIPIYPYGKKPLHERKYRSLYPLHDHHASSNLLNRMVWYIDESGVGQYAVIVNNEIHSIEEEE